MGPNLVWCKQSVIGVSVAILNVNGDLLVFTVVFT